MFSRFIIVALGICGLIAMTISSSAQNSDDKNDIELTLQEKALLSRYDGGVELPDLLVRAYARFAAATSNATEDTIKDFALPYSVSITTTKREEKTREYGVDMNLPFLKDSFDKQLLNLRKESEYCYLLRTGTSYIRYVKTAAGEWKIYDYGDKPLC